MKKSLTFLLLFVSLHTLATHIVGGQFRMRHLSEYRYRVDLIVYIDELNSQFPASVPDVEPFILAKIFRSSDDAFIREVTLMYHSSSAVTTIYPHCANNGLVVSQQNYTTVVTLEPEDFNDTEGYYIVWERCCRNYTITNIFSTDPATGPNYAGQTFLLHFPPVVKGGEPFVNSSPEWPVANADYACTGSMFYSSFAAIDVDGDSLAYSLVTPLSTSSGMALPDIGPQPYPEISWRVPFHAGNIMNGEPDLRIDHFTGTLSVTTNTQGIFVFAVKCEEFREGVKIGEVRRDYELLVIDCIEEIAPVISARTSNGIYTESLLNIYFDSTTVATERCIQVKVEDDNLLSEAFENIRVKTIPLESDSDLADFLPDEVTATLIQTQPFAELSICFNGCRPSNRSQFQVGIVAYDDACGLPLTDTVKVTISIHPSIAACLSQTIDFPPIENKTYGDAPFALHAVSSSGLPITYFSADTSIASINETIVTMHKPGQAVITATQSGNEIFRKAAPVEHRFCINPLPPVLTVEARDTVIVIVSNYEAQHVWFKNDHQIDHTSNFLEITDLAAYSASVEVDNCMSEPSESILITSLDDHADQRELEIFPNPAMDILTIHFSGNGKNRSIEFLNTSGQTLFLDDAPDQTQLVNIQNLLPGLYLLKVRNGTRLQVRKIFKE